ncbi:MAG: PilZ domain-containing protein [Spirochaetaceae bacterium]|jgi:hypothetical protein|nr:PilZ domain-containing protein [Spirochaetaceae bacterium]
MFNKRKSNRYLTHARVRIPAACIEEAFLRDISITGCRIESTINIDVKANESYKIEIFPEASAEIGRFEIIAESRWIRPGGYSYEAGFRIAASPKGKLFQRYVDYLSWRNGAPSPSGGTSPSCS